MCSFVIKLQSFSYAVCQSSEYSSAADFVILVYFTLRSNKLFLLLISLSVVLMFLLCFFIFFFCRIGQSICSRYDYYLHHTVYRQCRKSDSICFRKFKFRENCGCLGIFLTSCSCSPSSSFSQDAFFSREFHCSSFSRFVDRNVAKLVFAELWLAWTFKLAILSIGTRVVINLITNE